MRVQVEGYKKSLIYNMDAQSFETSETLISNTKPTSVDWIRPKDIFVLDLEIQTQVFSSIIIEIINGIGTKHILIHAKLTPVEELFDFLDDLETSEINTIQLILEYSDEFYSDHFGDLVFYSKKITTVIVYNSPFEKNFSDCILYYQKQVIRNNFKEKALFNVNYELFYESQLHNTYFNRKLYIGPNGEIKNAPECEDSFGFIQDIDNPNQLKSIIQTPEFQKYWLVHKEISDVCKDCEFRHMCVDNRLPFKRKENEWYHKIECNYNPYIAKWEGEEGYKTLEECGVISNESGFSIDHDKIAKINAELWSE